jgi:hypothetical protein
MKRTIWSLLATLSFLALPALADAPENPDVQSPAEIEAARQRVAHDFANIVHPESFSPQQRAQILDQYGYIDPNHWIPTDLLEQALLYFDANKAGFPNQAFVSIVDFHPRSDAYRFFVIHMADGTVERYHTTHAVHSDPTDSGYATIFGNVINSGKSSLGPVRTAETYVGTYKRALRIDGLADTNSNIRARAVVVHGWDKVHESNVIQGLSHGCMTLDWALKDAVIDEIKEGSLLYVGVSK